MSRYGVLMRSVCEMVVFVEADSASEAKQKARNGALDDMGEYEPVGDWTCAKKPAWVVEEDE